MFDLQKLITIYFPKRLYQNMKISLLPTFHGNAAFLIIEQKNGNYSH